MVVEHFSTRGRIVGLRTYIIRRLLAIIPTFFLTTMLVFTLINLAPGDPVLVMLAMRGKSGSPEMIEQMKQALGLDKPPHIRYLMWLSAFLRGDLGFSYSTGQPTIKMITDRLWWTLELMLVTEIVSLALGIILGVIAAVKHGSLIDAGSSLSALVGYSIPSFWLGLELLLVFSFLLGWFPTYGAQTSGTTFPSLFDALLDHLRHLVLPVIALTSAWVAYILRLVRSTMLEVLRQDYILTARAKGLKERIVIFKHALRNVLLPLVTYEGYSIGFLLGGAVVIETVFSWPGLGKFAVDVALRRDYPPIMGLTAIIAVMVLLSNLCADIAYAIVDPRIRYD